MIYMFEYKLYLIIYSFTFAKYHWSLIELELLDILNFKNTRFLKKNCNDF